MNILVTGVAGFIGNELALRLIERGDEVTGVDNLNDYYNVSLKEARLDRLSSFSNFEFHKLDISDRAEMEKLFSGNSFDSAVNLSAQAGVRYSIEHPEEYIDSNIVGFGNILEGCRHGGVGHLVFASTSSVYGANTNMPFSESDPVDHPISMYAATKKANELMAHAYSHLYNLPATGLRFFTVYGPWGRPDMALFRFTQGILSGKQLDVYNHGNMVRDFTYISDIIDGVVLSIDRKATPNLSWDGDQPNSATSSAPYRIYNIGNGTPVNLMTFIELLENELGRKARLNMMDLQEGDVPITHSDVSLLANDVGYEPRVSVEEGIRRFVSWYKEYYDVG